MGCVPSKESVPRITKVEHKDLDDTDSFNPVIGSVDAVVSDSDIIRMKDEETLKDIRRDLNETPELFVLNNVIMSTFFYRNYKRELEILKDQIQKQDERFVEPDGIVENVNKNLTYRPFHGIKKNAQESLVTKRIYVPVNDIVDIIKDESSENESDNGNKYVLELEECRKKGYLKLKHVNQSQLADKTSSKETLFAPSSSTSGTSDTSSEATSVATANPQFLKDQNDDSIRELQDCFVYRKKKKQDADLNLEDAKESITEEDVYTVVHYLTSKDFMKYFQTKIFRDGVAKELGLVQYEIDNAIVDECNNPGKIFCNILDNDGHSYPIEVIPCINIPWPDNQTLEFFPQNLVKDLHESFAWPTREMVQDIKQLNCALVPRGCKRKRVQTRDYPECDLEWEIHFPLAERYIESWMRPQQIKCYLILLAIYKEFIEGLTKRHGIGPEHLRTFIFWESENDYNSWPEHRLGTKLMTLFKNLEYSLHLAYLPHYFLGRHKNVFRSLNKKHLNVANEVFHKILQSPLMMIIKALRNLRPTNDQFYPSLNYKELLNILYKKFWELPISVALNGTATKPVSVKKPKFSDAEKQLEFQRELERKKRLINKRKTKNIEVRRESLDSVDLEWECETNFEHQKKVALLKFFINNYLDIAKACRRISTKNQAQFFLKQAWYLTRIFQIENALCETEAQEFFNQIQEQEAECDSMEENVVIRESDSEVNSEDLDNFPISPSKFRQSFSGQEFSFDSDPSQSYGEHLSDLHQQVRHTKINLRTLSRSFSNHYPNMDDDL